MPSLIQARVSPKLLTQAERMFTGTLYGRAVEALQNARRAGATEVKITNRPIDPEQQERFLVTIQDDGRGVADFQTLLEMGDNEGWRQNTREAEDPAGVGFFSLAPREVAVASGSRQVVITPSVWLGEPVEVAAAETPVKGTRLQFVDEKWDFDTVRRCAEYSGLQVAVDGLAIEPRTFLPESAGPIEHVPELGIRFQLRPRDTCFTDGHFNFYGHRLREDLALPHGPGLSAWIEFTGEPTPLRFLLPARTKLLENDARRELQLLLQRAIYQRVLEQGEHALPYSEYQQAHTLGILLPEAKPTFTYGTYSGSLNTPASTTPEECQLPLEECFCLTEQTRFERVVPEELLPTDKNQRQSDLEDAVIAVHFAAVHAAASQTFCPITIDAGYRAYSWAHCVPRATHVRLVVGPVRHEDYLWSGTLTVVESLRLEVTLSTGQVLVAAPPLAALDSDYYVALMTPGAEERTPSSDFWLLLGDYCDDGDVYETQSSQFDEQFDRFVAAYQGPSGYVRRLAAEFLEAIDRLQRDRADVRPSAGGPFRTVRTARLTQSDREEPSVEIVYSDGSAERFLSPA